MPTQRRLPDGPMMAVLRRWPASKATKTAARRRPLNSARSMSRRQMKGTLVAAACGWPAKPLTERGRRTTSLTSVAVARDNSRPTAAEVEGSWAPSANTLAVGAAATLPRRALCRAATALARCKDSPTTAAVDGTAGAELATPLMVGWNPWMVAGAGYRQCCRIKGLAWPMQQPTWETRPGSCGWLLRCPHYMPVASQVSQRRRRYIVVV